MFGGEWWDMRFDFLFPSFKIAKILHHKKLKDGLLHLSGGHTTLLHDKIYIKGLALNCFSTEY